VRLLERETRGTLVSLGRGFEVREVFVCVRVCVRRDALRA
jgi:hypothetical protein